MNDWGYQQFESAILALPPRVRELFCCACAEHALPFYEQYQKNSELRVTLDTVWEYARTNKFSIEQVEELEERIIPLIPNIQEDQSVEADISMKSGVALLETLNCLMGNEDAALNCGSSIFDTLVLADHIIQNQIVRELSEIISEPLPSEVWIRDEWFYILSMLEQLKTDGLNCYTVEWQDEQRARGRELLTIFEAHQKR